MNLPKILKKPRLLFLFGILLVLLLIFASQVSAYVSTRPPPTGTQAPPDYKIDVFEPAVYYAEEMPNADVGPFLKEETKLLATIADRLGHFLMYKHIRHVFQEYRAARRDLSEHKIEEWRVALNLLRETDHNLFLKISRRMLPYQM